MSFFKIRLQKCETVLRNLDDFSNTERWMLLARSAFHGFQIGFQRCKSMSQPLIPKSDLIQLRNRKFQSLSNQPPTPLSWVNETSMLSCAAWRYPPRARAARQCSRSPSPCSRGCSEVDRGASGDPAGRRPWPLALPCGGATARGLKT